MTKIIELIGGPLDREIRAISDEMAKGFELNFFGPPDRAELAVRHEPVPEEIVRPNVVTYVKSSDPRYWIHKTTG